MDTMEQKAKIVLAYELSTETDISQKPIFEKVDLGNPQSEERKRANRKADPVVKRWSWNLLSIFWNRKDCTCQFRQYTEF